MTSAEGVFTGVGPFTRFTVRRERVRAVVWVA